MLGLSRRAGSRAAAWALSQSAGFRRRSVAAEKLEMQEHLQLLDGRDEPFDIESYTNLLQLCTKFMAVPEGRKVHAHIVKSRMERERFIGNDLVFMYACFGEVEEARRIFDSLLNKNIFSWSAIIKAYVQSGNGKEALKLFHSMKLQPIKPDEKIYSMAVDACGMSRSLAEGRAIHANIRRSGMESNPAVATALIGMYTNCGALEAAARIFEKTWHLGSVCVWNAGIAAYAQNGHHAKAFSLFRLMDLEGISPNSGTFVKVLTTCSSPKDLARCRIIHSCIASREFRKASDILDVSVSLVKTYGQHCGSLKNATRVFCRMEKRRDVRAWNAMIGAYVKHGKKVDATNSFEQMHLEDVVPDRETYLLVLAASPPLRECKRIHASILQNKLKLDSRLQDSLARAYGKTKEGRNGKKTLLKMHKRIGEWRKKKLAAQSYVPSHFDFQD